eukprot:3871155-Pleurochrysis_carterae.AAC.2
MRRARIQAVRVTSRGRSARRQPPPPSHTLASARVLDVSIYMCVHRRQRLLGAGCNLPTLVALLHHEARKRYTLRILWESWGAHADLPPPVMAGIAGDSHFPLEALPAGRKQCTDIFEPSFEISSLTPRSDVSYLEAPPTDRSGRQKRPIMLARCCFLAAGSCIMDD